MGTKTRVFMSPTPRNLIFLYIFCLQEWVHLTTKSQDFRHPPLLRSLLRVLLNMKTLSVGALRCRSLLLKNTSLRSWTSTSVYLPGKFLLNWIQRPEFPRQRRRTPITRVSALCLRVSMKLFFNSRSPHIRKSQTNQWKLFMKVLILQNWALEKNKTLREESMTP